MTTATGNAPGASASRILFDPDAAQKLVLKLTGTVCNIDCTYCAEKRKELDFSRFMTPQTLEKALLAVDKPISVLFHGGEPLLVGPSRFRDLLEVIRRNHKRVVSVGIQTNGTLLDTRWTDLLFGEFADLDLGVSISLDGTRAMNGLRVTYAGDGTFDRVIAAFGLLHDVGRKVGLLSVIGRHALEHQDEYVQFLNGIPNLLFVKINPLYDSRPGSLLPDSITPSEFTRFLQGVASEWIRTRAYERYPIEPLLSFVQVLGGIDSKFCNFNNRKCLNYATVYPDGTMGICDNFSKEEFPIPVREGRGLTETLGELAGSERMAPFVELLARCDGCEIRKLCGGGCLSQRLYFHRNVPELYEDYCVHRKEMFDFMRSISGMS
jgi:uncharacterized protein